MPLTRTRSQALIGFPAKKSTRASRSKLTIDDEIVEQSPATKSRKRVARKDSILIESGCSPSKRPREKSTPDENATKPRSRKEKSVQDENSFRPQSPIRSSLQERIPLSPVKTIMMSPQKLLHKNVIPMSPSKNISYTMNRNINPLTPSKMVTPLTPSKNVTPSKNLTHLSPFKMASPHRNVTPLLKSPGKENSESPKSVRALAFGSPERCLTPSKLKPTVITKGRALSFDTPQVGGSPKKLMASPRKSLCVKPVVSPMMLKRQESLCYQRAKQALHTAMPNKLLCREKELAVVSDFLDKHLYKKSPGSLYISGAPGTGKTAVLTHTMEKLRSEKQHLVYVNCMSLRNSQAIYNKILSEVKGKNTCLSVKQAQSELEKQLSSSGGMVVLVLDEMDQLDSKNQEILYTMFEWPSLSKSRLVLIGIANALDLTDRILPRLQAHPKCRPQLLNFPPYSRDQIVTVLQERLKQVEVDGHCVLETSALRFCASKVAALAGDMRKALDVCRRAVEMVEGEVRKQQILAARACASPTKKSVVPRKIGVPHIMKIVNEVYGSRVTIQAGQQQTVPLQQKLAICSLLLMLKQGKAKEVTAGKLHEMYCKVCQKQNVGPVDQSEFLSICTLIEARGIMGSKRSKDTRSTKISLKLDESELEIALQDKTLISSVLKNGL